jgi:hypothetical protein
MAQCRVDRSAYRFSCFCSVQLSLLPRSKDGNRSSGHEIAKSEGQTTDIKALEELLKYAKDPANGIWIDTVEAVGKYVQKHRSDTH